MIKLNNCQKIYNISFRARSSWKKREKYKKDILAYKKRGFRKIKIDDVLYDIDNVPEINKKIKHDIYILVDRIVLNSSLGNRLAEGVETSINLANGLLFVEYENETLQKKFRKNRKINFLNKTLLVQKVVSLLKK